MKNISHFVAFEERLIRSKNFKDFWLVLVCVGLGIALIFIKNQASRQEREYAERNSALSNSLVQANDQLEQQKQVAADLYAERERRIEELDALTNTYVASLATLSQVSNRLTRTEAALKTSQEEAAKSDTKIAGLEAQNQALDKQAVDLSIAITNLTTQIEETKRKLATSEGEKGFLEKELKPSWPIRRNWSGNSTTSLCSAHSSPS